MLLIQTDLRSETECVACPAGNYCIDGTITSTCRAGYFCKTGADSPTPNRYFANISWLLEVFEYKLLMKHTLKVALDHLPCGASAVTLALSATPIRFNYVSVSTRTTRTSYTTRYGRSSIVDPVQPGIIVQQGLRIPRSVRTPLLGKTFFLIRTLLYLHEILRGKRWSSV